MDTQYALICGPVSEPRDVPSLLSGGSFRTHWPGVLLALTAGRIRRADVEREWEAQIARAETAGVRVTHLDSHQNLHLHPLLFPVAVALARRFRVPFVRAPRADDPPGRPDAPLLSRLRARLLARLGRRGRRHLDEAGLPEPPRVLGLAEAEIAFLEEIGPVIFWSAQRGGGDPEGKSTELNRHALAAAQNSRENKGTRGTIVSASLSISVA